MNITTVESSTLRTIAYDESLALLRLEFRSRVVPVEVHQALLRASSIGACFNETVRGCFPFDRVSDVDSARRREEAL